MSSAHQGWEGPRRKSHQNALYEVAPGRDDTSFAVAITKTWDVFSCNQVINVPNTLDVVPPSVWPDDPVPENPFSSSSSHRIAGATASAVLIAFRIFSSEDPTRLPSPFPRLNAEAACARLHRLLCTRTYRIPEHRRVADLGAGSKVTCILTERSFRSFSQFFKPPRPPTSEKLSSV